MPPFDVVGIGALNVDRLYRVPRTITDGAELTGEATVDAGGCAANTAYALAKLGLRCAFLGTVGDDVDADIVLRPFMEAGVDTRGIVRKADTATGQVFIVADPQGHRAMYVQSGANALFSAQDVQSAYLPDARAIHVSSFNGELGSDVVDRVLEAVPDGALVALSLDGLLARGGLQAIRRLVARCDLMLANFRELAELTQKETAAAVETLRELGCRTVVVTFGGGAREPWLEGVPGACEGPVACYIASAGGQWAVPALRTYEGPLVDATGAGDAFAAGFLWGMLNDWPLLRCGSLGHVLAGFCLKALGCRAGIPSAGELLQRHERFFGQEG